MDYGLWTPPDLDPTTPEFHFWLRHARRSQEPVVELFAGEGRVVRALAEQQLRLIAVEPDEAKRRAGEARARELEIRWDGRNPATFRLERKSGMVFLAGRAFERFLTLEEQKAALANIHAQLQIGGKLAFDLGIPDAESLRNESKRPGPLRPLDAITDPESGETIYRFASTRYELLQQLAHHHHIYERVGRDGNTIRRWHRTFERAFHWPLGMRLLLEQAGFEVEAGYGGWNDEPLDSQSVEQIWVARRGL
jgi:hypothetical protein